MSPFNSYMVTSTFQYWYSITFPWQKLKIHDLATHHILQSKWSTTYKCTPESVVISATRNNNVKKIKPVIYLQTVFTLWFICVTFTELLSAVEKILLNKASTIWILARTTRVRWYQKVKPKPIWLPGARDSAWQWYQLDHMQIVCTLLQTDNHASTSSLSFYRPDALPDTQPTVSKHWRHMAWKSVDLDGVWMKTTVVHFCWHICAPQIIDKKHQE